MCKLRRNFHSALATRWYGPLPVQRVRSLPQDERNESTLGEAATAIGKEEMEEIRRPAKRSRERWFGEFLVESANARLASDSLPFAALSPDHFLRFHWKGEKVRSRESGAAYI